MRRMGLLSASLIQTIWLSDLPTAEEIADWHELPYAP